MGNWYKNYLQKRRQRGPIERQQAARRFRIAAVVGCVLLLGLKLSMSSILEGRPDLKARMGPTLVNVLTYQNEKMLEVLQNQIIELVVAFTIGLVVRRPAE